MSGSGWTGITSIFLKSKQPEDQAEEAGSANAGAGRTAAATATGAQATAYTPPPPQAGAPSQALTGLSELVMKAATPRLASFLRQLAILEGRIHDPDARHDTAFEIVQVSNPDLTMNMLLADVDALQRELEHQAQLFGQAMDGERKNAIGTRTAEIERIAQNIKQMTEQMAQMSQRSQTLSGEAAVEQARIDQAERDFAGASAQLGATITETRGNIERYLGNNLPPAGK